MNVMVKTKSEGEKKFSKRSSIFSSSPTHHESPCKNILFEQVINGTFLQKTGFKVSCY